MNIAKRAQGKYASKSSSLSGSKLLKINGNIGDG